MEGSKIAPMAWGQLSLRVSLKPLAPSTVHTVYAVLRSLTLSAVEDQLIPANPCSRVPLQVPRSETFYASTLIADGLPPR